MNIFTQKFIRSTVQGFTLVETLAATFVITVVILGPLTVAINASAYARETKDTMIATYLAEEALELLHHQQDSVYLRCVSSTNTNCTLTDPDSDGIYESPKEAAWRIFRARLAGNAQGADCFASAGCSYDMIHFTTNGDANPTKYVATDTSCNSLSVTTQNTYVCSGVPSHVGSGSVATTFSRMIQITAIDTFSESGTKYNDDFRVTATVTFRRANGYTKQVQVVDFLHARS